MKINKTTERERLLNDRQLGAGPIIYWMNRDQRLVDNFALLSAYELARRQDVSLIVLFVLFPGFEQLKFDDKNPIYVRMGQGLLEVIKDAKRLGINLLMRQGEPLQLIPKLLNSLNAGGLVTDFSPLKEMMELRQNIAKAIPISMVEVDAHNVVPVRIASDHQEWGAYTLRPKINKLLPQYLKDIPIVRTNDLPTIDIEKGVAAWLEMLPPLLSSEDAMSSFINERLPDYHFRNNPNLDVTSRLSAYLHFGNISATRLALEVISSGHPYEEFIEEMVVRRELAENYCFYNQNYKTLDGCPAWAKKTLEAHRLDPREYIYSLEQLERGETHDPVWNAAQKQMTSTNYMHGYMRMYWAKKILEWTPNPETAFAYAIYLNDKYQLDGRDPNGYTGIAWALGGVHDRPWGERPIFGMIRYMNMAGLKRKFGIDEYIAKWNPETTDLV